MINDKNVNPPVLTPEEEMVGQAYVNE